MSRTWLVTGCSTGIGRAIATHLLQIGEQVVVTARRPQDVADIVQIAPEHALSLALDVADPEAAPRAVAAAEARFGQVDVLVNNAGYGYVSAIEEGDEAAVKAMFEVNVFGAWRMMRAVLPAMRARNAGRIIQISSLAGRIANPATGFYSASKHALEALSEALARELAGTAVKVTSVAPGLFPTDFGGRSLKVGGTAIPEYRDTAHARMELVRSNYGGEGDPARLAQALVALVELEDPPIRLLAGSDAYAAVTARMAEQRESIEAWRALTFSTDRAAKD